MHTSWCRVMSHKNSQIIKKHVISFPFWSRKKCTIDSQESKLFRNDAQGLGERARLRDCPFFTVCPVRFSCERLPGRFVTSPVSKRLVVGGCRCVCGLKFYGLFRANRCKLPGLQSFLPNCGYLQHRKSAWRNSQRWKVKVHAVLYASILSAGERTYKEWRILLDCEMEFTVMNQWKKKTSILWLKAEGKVTRVSKWDHYTDSIKFGAVVLLVKVKIHDRD